MSVTIPCDLIIFICKPPCGKTLHKKNQTSVISGYSDWNVDNPVYTDIFALCPDRALNRQCAEAGMLLLKPFSSPFHLPVFIVQ
jgi:hypothetical protein